MTASDFKFEPNNITARVGTAITFRINNTSGITHNFTLKDPDGENMKSIDIPARESVEVHAAFAKREHINLSAIRQAIASWECKVRLSCRNNRDLKYHRLACFQGPKPRGIGKNRSFPYRHPEDRVIKENRSFFPWSVHGLSDANSNRSAGCPLRTFPGMPGHSAQDERCVQINVLPQQIL